MMSALSLIVVGIFYAVIFPSNPEFDNGLLNPAGYFVLAAAGLSPSYFPS